MRRFLAVSTLMLVGGVLLLAAGAQATPAIPPPPTLYPLVFVSGGGNVWEQDHQLLPTDSYVDHDGHRQAYRDTTYGNVSLLASGVRKFDPGSFVVSTDGSHYAYSWGGWIAGVVPDTGIFAAATGLPARATQLYWKGVEFNQVYAAATHHGKVLNLGMGPKGPGLYFVSIPDGHATKVSVPKGPGCGFVCSLGKGTTTALGCSSEASCAAMAVVAAIPGGEEEALAARATEDDVALARYAEGGGHHIPAKSAFKGETSYDPAEALAVPNAELERLGVSHARITGAQQTLYRQFAASGKPLTWDAMAAIERRALTAGGMDSGTAATAVERAIAALQRAGVTGPTRIPWGG